MNARRLSLPQEGEAEPGVGISIDDVGIGYSPFDYLKRLPIDQLKLDRSPVQGIEDDPKDLAIVQTIASLARGLALALVAEGVERAEQEALLTDCYCGQLQGFHYGRPTAMMRRGIDAARSAVTSRWTWLAIRATSSPLGTVGTPMSCIG